MSRPETAQEAGVVLHRLHDEAVDKLRDTRQRIEQARRQLRTLETGEKMYQAQIMAYRTGMQEIGYEPTAPFPAIEESLNVRPEPPIRLEPTPQGA